MSIPCIKHAPADFKYLHNLAYTSHDIQDICSAVNVVLPRSSRVACLVSAVRPGLAG